MMHSKKSHAEQVEYMNIDKSTGKRKFRVQRSKHA